ncbi:transcriptional adapter 2-alpha [Anaeramoeba flamelloides]|uniref:Transcriptional adapter 2-alpha n=1 Tax=Anaeramoeba flamelloides TaxID=1746091 RepID=A0AAV7YNS7_9EUKA|nr:transcriptional adapter 2-alpha [Anaeramoeba flamelloides]
MNKNNKVARIHCMSCNEDLTNSIIVKCAICDSMMMCVVCFMKGVQLNDHQPNHDYQVFNCQETPIYQMRWSLKDEVLLLEAIDKCGLGNWSKIARIVNTKTKLQCKLHFERVYIQSKIFPYPSNKTILGAIRRFGKKKNCRERLIPTTDSTPSITTPSVNVGSGAGANVNVTATATTTTAIGKENTETSSINQKDLQKKQHKIQELRRSPIKRKYKGKLNQKKSRNKTVGELLGFLPKRYEFDVEYDDDCEEMINSLGFIDKSLSWELKLNVLQAFNKKIEEREKRKAFVVKMDLIEKPFTKNKPIDQISGELLNEKNGLKQIKKNQKSNKLHDKNKQMRKGNGGKNNNEGPSIGDIKNNKNGLYLNPKANDELKFLSKLKTFARCFNSSNEYENFQNKLLQEFRIKSQIQQLINWSNNGIKSISGGLKFEKTLKKNDEFKKRRLIEQKRKRKRTNKIMKRGIKINTRKKNENKKNNISKKLFNGLNNNKNNNDNDNNNNSSSNNDGDDNNGNNNFLNKNSNVQNLNVDSQLLNGDTHSLLTLILPPSKTTILSTLPQNNNNDNDINCFQNRIPNENFELKIQLDQNKTSNINKNPINNLKTVAMDIESNENSFFPNENK